MTTRTNTRTGRWGVVIFWCMILAMVGALLRVMAPGRASSGTRTVRLERPLSEVPMTFGPWEGVDVPVDPRVLEVAKNDDYVSRRYIDRAKGQFVDMYVAYTARPANMLGHRPSVCYPAQGWLPTEPRTVTLSLANGTRMDCLIHHYRRDEPNIENLVVLNYYVLQGKTTTDWTDFWTLKWRRPNADGDPSFYVAQVQVATPIMIPALMDRGDALVQRFAAEVTPLIKSLLPRTDEYEASVSAAAAAVELP